MAAGLTVAMCAPSSLLKIHSVENVVTGENTNRRIWGQPVSTHAEMDALRKIYKMSGDKAKKYEKCDILVIRISKSGKLGQSRPCYHCLSSLSVCDLKIRYIYYSTNEGTIVRERFDGMLDSDLTIVSTGWRKRLGVGKTIDSKSDDDSTDSASTDSTGTSKSKGSKESKSKIVAAKGNPYKHGTKPVKEKTITLIGPGGERIFVNELEYSKLRSRSSK